MCMPTTVYTGSYILIDLLGCGVCAFRNGIEGIVQCRAARKTIRIR